MITVSSLNVGGGETWQFFPNVLEEGFTLSEKVAIRSAFVLLESYLQDLHDRTQRKEIEGMEIEISDGKKFILTPIVG